MIFFGRHGHPNNNDCLTPYGLGQLDRLNSWLQERGFRSTLSFSSSENRNLETVESLAPGSDVLVLPALHAYGDQRRVGIETGKRPLWLPAQTYARHVYAQIKSLTIGTQDTLVISHDSTSVLLAQQHLAEQGVSVHWDEKIKFPNPGEGVLVFDDHYECFTHSGKAISL